MSTANPHDIMLGNYPFTLTDELRWILGQPIFTLAGVFQTLRAGGHPINKRFEDEQAYTIFWMLSLYAQYGPAGWRAAAVAELKAIHDAQEKTEQAP